MNKKNYFAPSIQEMRLAMTAKICQASNEVTSISGNVGLNGPQKGDASIKARSNDRGNDAEWGNLW